jgi:CRISPR type III-associated protein (TIGR04423 family)
MYKININEIPDINYEGYLWYSDKTKPEIINSKKRFGKSMMKELPFVIEGNLWAEIEKISISIKNIDGEYQIFKYDLNSVNIETNSQKYRAHDLGEVKEFTLYQHWVGEEDLLCEGMKTLVPSWTAFTGFIKNKGGE